MIWLQRIVRAVRWSFEAFVVVMVYKETGVWTGIFAVLVTLAIELQDLVNRMIVNEMSQTVNMGTEALERIGAALRGEKK